MGDKAVPAVTSLILQEQAFTQQQLLIALVSDTVCTTCCMRTSTQNHRRFIAQMASTLGSSSHMVRLFPRRKQGDTEGTPQGRFGRRACVLDAAAIAEYFKCHQSEAARKLGISVTTLKQACRKLGIARWPGPKRQSGRAQANREVQQPRTHNTNQEPRDCSTPFRSFAKPMTNQYCACPADE